MKPGVFSLAFFIAGWGLCHAMAEGDFVNYAANPYGVIAQRNVFHLNPAPAPTAPEVAAPTALPDVWLSGFVQSGSEWTVFMVVKVKNLDPVGAPLNSYLNLAEGGIKEVMSDQTRLEIKLVKVYADLEKVDIVNCGTPMTLSLKDNSFGNFTNKYISHVITAEQRLAANNATAAAGIKRPIRNVTGAPLKPRRLAPPDPQINAPQPDPPISAPPGDESTANAQ
jgi:hypothetical protein